MDPIIWYAIFLAIGGLILRQIRKFGLTVWLCERNPRLEEFVECDLCIGSWLYMGLALLMGVELKVSPLVSLLGKVANIGVTGMVSAFVLMVLKEGISHYTLMHYVVDDFEAEVEMEKDAEQDSEGCSEDASSWSGEDLGRSL